MPETGLFQVAAPFIQYGFAGFCVLQLGVLVWMAKGLFQVLTENNKVIERNTAAIEKMNEGQNSEMALIRDLRDKVMSRHCMVKGES